MKDRGRSVPRITPVLALVLVVLAAPACGASLQALYEGDVRFEHCMALDSRPDVKPTIRRACWQEWRKFYTFGQTRDRVEYAAIRERQLARSSDFDEGEWMADSLAGKRAVPEPTSVLAPPPILLHAPNADAAAPLAEAGIALDAGRDAPAPLVKECTDACQQELPTCVDQCKTPKCQAICKDKHAACIAKCGEAQSKPSR
jgi:hypothetical protein